MKIYDLSQPLNQDCSFWPFYPPFEVKYIKRKSEQGVNAQYIQTSNHMGTHLDAPRHFVTNGKTIDQLPVEWFYSDGVVIDMRHKRPGELITSWDLKKALHQIKYEINPYDIVLVMTGADKLLGTKEYWSEFPGLSKESTLWLCEQGVKVVGTDSAGWDRPFWAMVEEFKETESRSDKVNNSGEPK